jgi:ribosomal protein S8
MAKFKKKIGNVIVKVIYDEGFISRDDFDDPQLIKDLELGRITPYGIVAYATIMIPMGDHWAIQEISSGGLWGILLNNSESSKKYVKEVAEEQVGELMIILKALGYLQAFKTFGFNNYKIKYP